MTLEIPTMFSVIQSTYNAKIMGPSARATFETLRWGLSPGDPRYMTIYPHHIDPRPTANMWNALPNELWDAIFPRIEMEDMLSLCLVNKRLKLLAEPHIYSEISYLPDPHFTDSWVSLVEDAWKLKRKRVVPATPPHSKLLLLLRTFLCRPEVALYVKRFEFITPCMTNEDGGISQKYIPYWGPRVLKATKLDDDEIEIAWSHIKEMGLASIGWLEGLEQGRSDVITALVLSYLSNLRTMNIRLRRSAYEHQTHIGEKINSILAYSPTGTKNCIQQSLKSVEISKASNGWYQNENFFIESLYKDLAFVFANPSVEQLQLTWTIATSIDGTRPPIGSQLKILHLRDRQHNNAVFDVWDRDLKGFLEATPVLEKLDVVFTFGPWPENCRTSSGLVIVEALQLVRKTLKSLHIGFSSTDRFHSNVAIISTLGSMISFTKLTRFHVPSALIIAPNDRITALPSLLPPHLEWFGMGAFPFPTNHADISQEFDQFWGSNFTNRRWYYDADKEIVRY